MRFSKMVLPAVAGILALPTLALAHAGHHHAADGAFASGLLHPLTGLDHLVAMVAVGLWAAQIGGRAVWALPVAFVAALVAGGALAMAGVGLPLVEGGIAASVFVLGACILAAFRPPLAAALGATAGFALFHGYAHGAEMAAGVSGVVYTTGFALSTLALHGIGLAAGLGVRRVGGEAPDGLIYRLGGAGVLCAGLLVVLF